MASGHYRPFTAHKLAVSRRARPKVRKLASDEVLRSFVQDRLEKRWSPEQICQALRIEFRDTPSRHLVHETIYQAPTPATAPSVVTCAGHCGPEDGGASPGVGQMPVVPTGSSIP